MSRKTFLGEYVFFLFLLPLVASITGCNPAETESLLSSYRIALEAQYEPDGCHCRDNCGGGIMAPAGENGCGVHNDGARVRVTYLGQIYSVPVSCYCMCSTPISGQSRCACDEGKFEREAPQYRNSATVEVVEE